MLARIPRMMATAAAVLLGAIGVVVAPVAALGWIAAGVFVGVTATLLRLRDGPDGAGPATTMPARRAGLRVGGASCAAGLVLTGLVALLGPASGTVVVALLLLAGVLACSWLRRRSGRSAGQKNATAGIFEVVPAIQEPPQLAPETLSTQELCLAWRRSYLALLDVTSGPARWRIVLMRECLLDELERRDPDGFTRWLDTGARAGSNPGRYLTIDR
jgi:hypothetical protein